MRGWNDEIKDYELISEERYNELKKAGEQVAKGNFHPTIKSVSLMECFCNLTETPTGGVVLDLFGGSGTTGIGCIETGRDYIIIDKYKSHCIIAEYRLKYWKSKHDKRTKQGKEYNDLVKKDPLQQLKLEL